MVEARGAGAQPANAGARGENQDAASGRERRFSRRRPIACGGWEPPLLQ